MVHNKPLHSSYVTFIHFAITKMSESVRITVLDNGDCLPNAGETQNSVIQGFNSGNKCSTMSQQEGIYIGIAFDNVEKLKAL